MTKGLEEPCDLSDDERKILIERLAALEHDQWIYYSKVVSEQISKASSLAELKTRILSKWSPKWVPYSKLSEKDKEQDRVWANKVIKLISSN